MYQKNKDNIRPNHRPWNPHMIFIDWDILYRVNYIHKSNMFLHELYMARLV